MNWPSTNSYYSLRVSEDILSLIVAEFFRTGCVVCCVTIMLCVFENRSAHLLVPAGTVSDERFCCVTLRR